MGPISSFSSHLKLSFLECNRSWFLCPSSLTQCPHKTPQMTGFDMACPICRNNQKAGKAVNTGDKGKNSTRPSARRRGGKGQNKLYKTAGNNSSLSIAEMSLIKQHRRAILSTQMKQNPGFAIFFFVRCSYFSWSFSLSLALDHFKCILFICMIFFLIHNVATKLKKLIIVQS